MFSVVSTTSSLKKLDELEPLKLLENNVMSSLS